jgi:hypothetical protein
MEGAGGPFWSVFVRFCKWKAASELKGKIGGNQLNLRISAARAALILAFLKQLLLKLDKYQEQWS